MGKSKRAMRSTQSFAIGSAVCCAILISVAYTFGTRPSGALESVMTGARCRQIPRMHIQSSPSLPNMRRSHYLPAFAIKEPTAAATVAGDVGQQSWAILLDRVSRKETYQLPPAEKMDIVRQIYVARDDIKAAYDRTNEGSKRRRDMTLSLKRLKRFLKYGLLDCPDADVSLTIFKHRRCGAEL